MQDGIKTTAIPTFLKRESITFNRSEFNRSQNQNFYRRLFVRNSCATFEKQEAVFRIKMLKLMVTLCLLASCNLVAAKVTELFEDDWQQLLEGEWMVEL